MSPQQKNLFRKIAVGSAVFGIAFIILGGGSLREILLRSTPVFIAGIIAYSLFREK